MSIWDMPADEFLLLVAGMIKGKRDLSEMAQRYGRDHRGRARHDQCKCGEAKHIDNAQCRNCYYSSKRLSVDS